MSFLTKIFGTSNERILKSIKPLVEQINALEPKMMALTDAELRQKQMSLKKDYPGKPWMISCQRHLLP